MCAWATMTSMVENMCGLLVGSYLMVCPCLTRPGFARRFSYVERANAGGVGATLRVQTRKAPGELGSCVRRLMVIVYPSKFEYSTVRTVSCIAAETQQPQRKVAVCTDFTTSQISAHNSRCGGCCALWEYMWAGVGTLWDNMVQSAQESDLFVHSPKVARNSVVRQVFNSLKTAEFQRCDFKV